MKKSNGDNLKSMNLDNLNPDLKAYMYQQIYDFKPFFVEDSQVGIFLKQDPDEDNFEVTFRLSGGGTFVECSGRASNIIDATSKAKKGLLEHLNALMNRVVSAEEQGHDIESQDDDLEGDIGLAYSKRMIH